MKNKLILIVIAIILIVLVFFIGIQIGKIVEEKNIKNEMKNILENDNLRNEGFYLDVIKDSNKKQEEILNTKLIVKNKSRKEIEVIYSTYDEKEREATLKMFDTYYLLKKVGEDWYEANTPFMGISSTVNIIAKNEKIILGKKYDLKFSFLVQNSERQYGLPNGRYKLRIYSNSTDKELKYQLRYKEVEFEISDGVKYEKV
jgi:hypothetical protein